MDDISADSILLPLCMTGAFSSGPVALKGICFGLIQVVDGTDDKMRAAPSVFIVRPGPSS